MKRYMNHRQAAEYLGMSKKTLYRLVEKRQVPFGKRGKTLIYDRETLDNWVAECHMKRGATFVEAVKRYRTKGNLL